MSFVHLVALFSFVAIVLAKPLSAPIVVPRQDATAGAPLTPDQTSCGDIIINTKNSMFVPDDATSSDAKELQISLFSMPMKSSNACRAFPSMRLSRFASSTTTT